MPVMFIYSAIVAIAGLVLITTGARPWWAWDLLSLASAGVSQQ